MDVNYMRTEKLYNFRRQMTPADETARMQVDADRAIGQMGDQSGQVWRADISGLQRKSDSNAFTERRKCRQGFHKSSESPCFRFGRHPARTNDDDVCPQIGGEPHGFLSRQDTPFEIVRHVIPSARGKRHSGYAQIHVVDELMKLSQTSTRNVAWAEL
jgi:hypothetical protein